MNELKIYWIDLFCGAGGTSSGIHLASPNTTVLACVNHDVNAIKSHYENHPNAHHFTEDIRDFNVVVKLRKLVDEIRVNEPNAIISIWASLECTNFSNAKGGQPRNADSRSLAEHMFMYLEFLNPDFFWVENVKEFMSWGPLDDNNKPISKDKGKSYLKWIKDVQLNGYISDTRILNSADFGAVQSRKRLFVQFAKPYFPISWPEPTHCKNPGNSTLKKWRPVREVLDLNDQGVSIFNRKKPLVDNTIKVIINGIVKALEEKESCFLFKYYGTGDNLNSINYPAGTVTTKDRFGKVQMIFNQYKTGNITSTNQPLGTLTTTPKANLVSFIMNPSHFGHTKSIDESSMVVIARQDKAPLYLINALMAENGIVDIKMRMLNIPELKKIQGFPADYKLVGTQTQQKKYIGNAVEVNQAKAIVQNNYETLRGYLLKLAV